MAAVRSRSTASIAFRADRRGGVPLIGRSRPLHDRGLAWAVEEALLEGLDDWVMLHTVVWIGREAAQRQGGDFTSVTRELVGHVLREGLMVAGDLREAGFEAWGVPPDRACLRVLEQCERLSWNPVTDGCWLANTETGDALAREILSAQQRRDPDERVDDGAP